MLGTNVRIVFPSESVALFTRIPIFRVSKIPFEQFAVAHTIFTFADINYANSRYVGIATFSTSVAALGALTPH